MNFKVFDIFYYFDFKSFKIKYKLINLKSINKSYIGYNLKKKRLINILKISLDFKNKNNYFNIKRKDSKTI